mmetsp:Transcript_32513/g.36876  ORF Transcript_32513/g.36876 Transcript_32513/m.36876 type:complete len:273 (+) Transcript_32513:27-845(+)
MEILLDTRIRDWVLLPMVFVVFMTGILRHFLFAMFDSEEKKDKEESEIQANFALARSKTLRENFMYLPERAFKVRKSYFSRPQTGFYEKSMPDNSTANMMNAMQDPSMMMGMMKKNLRTGISSMLLYGWVDSFCSGFILAKIPFSLTQKFKGMLQRGVVLSGLDVSYVSSLSWYFLLMFGMQGLYRFFLGDSDIDDTAIFTMGMGKGGAGAAAGMPGQPGPDFGKLFTSEKESLSIVHYFEGLQKVESHFIDKRYNQLMSEMSKSASEKKRQ